MAPRWAAFLGLTLVVLLLVLALARLSADALRTAGRGADSGGDPRATPGPARAHANGRDDGSEGTAPDRPMARAPSASATEPGPDRGPDFHGPAAGGPDGPSLSTAALLANVSLSQGLVAVVLLAGAWYFAIPATALGVAADPWVTGLPALLVGTVFGAALWSANELGAAVADASGASYDERVRELLAPATPLGWVALLGVVLPTVAVAEELLFRASLVGVAHAGLGVSSWLLAAASSLAFAAGHGAQGRAGVLVTGVLGFGLAAGYVLTGSLLVVVVAHYLVNALEFVVHEGPGRSVLAAPDR